MSSKVTSIDKKAANELALLLESVWCFDASPDNQVALHEPLFSEKDLEYVRDAITSGFVSSVGFHVNRFGEMLSEFTGVSEAIPIVNGTSALQLALHLSGVRSGDEVAVPALSFIATANAVRFLGAEPVFVDSYSLESDLSMGMSHESFLELISTYEKGSEGIHNPKTGARLAAVVPMHTLGRLVGLDELTRTARSLGIAVVEDAAEALGSFKDGYHSGSTDTSILSFNGNKTITTGGGGAILTNNRELAAQARSLSSTAKEPHVWRFRHSDAGWNFRMPALNAALGCAQMEALPEILASKAELAGKYFEAFQGSEFFRYLPTDSNQTSNNWLSAIQLSSKEVVFDNLLDLINDKGIHCRPMWDLLSEQAPYKSNFRTRLDNAQEIRNSVICIPSSPKLRKR